MAAIIISLFVLGHLSPFVHGKFSHACSSVCIMYIYNYIYLCMDGWQMMLHVYSVYLIAIIHCTIIILSGQTSGDLRLVSASGSTGGSSGRLEVYYNGQWGTVCKDLFSRNDGQVACKQLGFDAADRYGTADTLG